MTFMIGIDTGGTFTDGFFTREGESRTVKVLTTPHDLTVCLADCVSEGARQFGISVKELLLNTDVVRFSSTIGVNAIVQRTGSKIGLIVSKGFKDSLYAMSPEEVEPIFSFIRRDMIAEVEGEIDDQGNIIKPLDNSEVLTKMQGMVDLGARAIVISLKNSNINATSERLIKKIIKERYPSFYLGSIRVFLASEISDQPDDFPRTNAAVISGYIHDSLVKYLYKAEDDLRTNLYKRPLMVGHSHGGTARVSKTRAIDTYSSGPILGVIGAEMIGKAYGFDNIVAVDIGGTTTDLGVIRDGIHNYSLTPVISGLPVSVPMIITHSVGLGGGSIINLNSSGGLRIGPESAGASPGPACFNLGGLKPTVTDADVTLGFINPMNFLGGKVKLDGEKAVSTIMRKISDPLGLSVEEAAYQIKEKTDKLIREEILSFLGAQGIDRGELSNYMLIAYGGAGPSHYGSFVEGLGFSKILTSPYSSVFSAAGFSSTDLLHTYSRSSKMLLFDGINYSMDFEKFSRTISELLKSARRDIKGEGFSPDNAVYYLELIGDDDLAGVRIRIDKTQIMSTDDIKKICDEFHRVTNKKPANISISMIILNAAVPLPHFELQSKPLSGEDPAKAFKVEREVFWSPQTGYRMTPVYELELLARGNVVVGPAIVESKDTTYVIPANRSFNIDQYSQAVIKEV